MRAERIRRFFEGEEDEHFNKQSELFLERQLTFGSYLQSIHSRSMPLFWFQHALVQNTGLIIS
jgi:hypothetical protein